MNEKPVLMKVTDLSVRFGGVKALSNASFVIGEGHITGLIGPNGAGKSTCLNAVTGFVKATGGSVEFLGKQILGRQAHDIARLGVVRTFQHTSLFGEVSVRENVRRALYLREGLSNGKRGTNDPERVITEICRKVGVEDYLGEVAGRLPYGAQRRLAIGLCLASEPKLILLDEPAAGMNPTESQQLAAILRTLSSEGLSVFLVEHDMKVIMKVCDNIVVLVNGEVLVQDIPPAVQQNAAVREAYLGVGREANA